MAECPSKAWDRHIADQERAETPTDSEMLEGLDAYGHLNWTVGSGEEGDERGDWLACFDFEVFDHPERGKLVAYHVVVNSESGHFIDTLETAVVEASKAPFDLPDYWTGIGIDQGDWTEEEVNQAHECNERWNKDLREALEVKEAE
jgi:hypothetical protein